MSLTNNGGDNMVMPVAPMYNGFNGGGNGFGGFGSWGSDFWLIFIVIIAMFGWGGFGGFGGFGGANGAAMDLTLPYFFNNTDNGVQAGFNQAATNTALAGIQTSLTNGFAGVEVNACNRAADAMATTYNNQIASMNQNFTNQLALQNQLNGMQAQQAQCCCDNKLLVSQLGADVAREACADRQAVNDGIRDVIANNTAQTQAIIDRLNAIELDGYKRENDNLRTQLNMASLNASQAAQTSQLIADNTAQTQYIVNRVAPVPVPAYVVSNPSGCNCGYNYGFGLA